MSRSLRGKAKDATAQIEAANQASNKDFIKKYMKPRDSWETWKHPKTGDAYTVELYGANDLSEDDFTACFNLIDSTSGGDYRSSAMGWHPSAKRKEMASPDLRYVVVKNKDGVIHGFTSFMPTFEDGRAVVYCYEIHLTLQLQGTGLGKLLMGYILSVGDNIDCVEKVMLTCFKANKGARAFYDKQEFTVDEFSPGERKLRGGKTFTPDYVILSRAIHRHKLQRPQKPQEPQGPS